MTDRELAELIWTEDGPTYQGWPDVGRRVDVRYWDQYPRHRDRCFRLAKAINAKIGNGERLTAEETK